MAYFKNKDQMLKATDEEIKDFFSNTVFEGVFSTEIKSKHTDSFKGHIHSIKVNGEPNNIIGNYINVPTSANDIPEGLCIFECRVKITPNQRNFSLSPKTLRSKTRRQDIKKEEISNEDIFDLWGVNDCKFIGYYHRDSNTNGYIIDDLRKPNFDRLPPYLCNNKAISLWLRYPQKDLELDNYYIFTWKLSHKDENNPYEIYLDDKYSPQPIEPRWFIDMLFEDRLSDTSKNFGSAANFLDTLSKQLSAKESTFVYELLQNANDYPVEGRKVDVEFHITEHYLLFLHSGDKFNVRNISGICGINEKEKVANKRAVGYKGIGFKTVFLHNHYVYLKTGDYSFRFDQGETPEKNLGKKRGGKISRQGAPFQILPIWTEHNEVSSEVNSVFDNADPKFQVQIALRPDDSQILHKGKNSYENLFRDVFSDSNIILFIPNINSVKVFINGREERVCFRNNDEWIVGDYEAEIADDLQDLINTTIDKGNSRIPEKYKDFDLTKVSFACKQTGGIIKPIEDATLYCYLPTGASWGLPFLMNTDMIPKGDRNDIETEVKLADEEETNFNEELASIAGSKLFLWIRDLLTSKNYHLGSVFSLTPDFEKCKREHKDYAGFIEKFEKAFGDCLDTETIIPVSKGIARVKSVILDTTGLSCSEIMTDEEFRKFTGMGDYYLPLPMLRKDQHFTSFLKRYAENDQKFEKENLENLIDNEDFQGWLKNQDNNNKFLNFLLENDYLKDLLKKKIFIEETCGSLYSAEELYYDIDAELADLSTFRNHLSFLSLKTREYFENNEKWDNVICGKFAEFDGENFINETLLNENWGETINALKNWDTSLHFYRYIANKEKEIVPAKLKNLPFFNDEDTAEIVDDFNDKFVFISSKSGKETCSAVWLSPVSFAFISPNYDDATLEYFKKYAGIRDYSDDIIVNDIILSKRYQDKINDSQQNDYDTSESFVQFCYKNKSLFNSGTLKGYALYAVGCDGDYTFVLSEDHIFFPSNDFDEYSKKEWINCDWMYSIDSDYLKIDSDSEKVKAFLKKVFCVKELDAKIFYKDIVRTNISDIIENTSGSNDSDRTKNVDFVSYLDDNYELIFKNEKDAEKFADFVFLSDSNDESLYDIDPDSTYIYAYNEELWDIINSDWFPADMVQMTTQKYGKSKAIIDIKAKKYNFYEFFDDVIVNELEDINKTIDSKESSIAFHTFVIKHLRDLTDSQKEKMRGAKVFLYGCDDASDTSDEHKILSQRAKELCSMGLVEFSDLDIIDPDYPIENNKDYWEKHLCNEQFEVKDFLNWLNENTLTFRETIKDKDNNIKFWRWVKKCDLSKETIKGLLGLPIFLRANKCTDSDEIIYLSDNYIEEGGWETIVKTYHPDAFFISSEYIKQNDNIDSWKDFWIKLGIRFGEVDILIDTIDNRLDEIEDAELPRTLAKFRSELDKHYGGELISKLTNLRVKAHSGEFYPLDKTVYIDCEKDEPFPYIELPNQISFDTAEQRKLVKEIINEINGDCIETLSEWQQRKLDCYLKMQNDNCESIREFHYRFINDLSLVRNSGKDSLEEIKHIENIYLLNRDDGFCEPTRVTMGSGYKPFFDFEKCGITSLEYISDSYISKCTEYPGKLFRALKVHCDIQKEDLGLLENRDCAIYFWKEYLIKKDAAISRIKDFISDNLFDDIACIPTKDYMKYPRDLYYGSEVSKYVKHIEDWENKIPLDNLPDIKINDTTLFNELPFKESLDFLDSLYALISVSGQSGRKQLLEWMIKNYNDSYAKKIAEYREDKNALWYNNNNENVHIQRLYALDNEEKSLEQYFKDNTRIINKNYFPGGASFRRVCDILEIKVISINDLQMEPYGDKTDNQKKDDLKLFALVMAGIIDSEEWHKLYDKYIGKINSLILHCCESIRITYKDDEDINQSLKKFYHKAGSNDFYFVDSLDNKRVYTLFVEEFTEFIGIKKGDIPQDMIEEIMDSRQNALGLIKKHNSLMLDEAFKDELNKLVPGIKQELKGNTANEDDDETVIHRPAFTTTEGEQNGDKYKESDSDMPEDVNNNGSSKGLTPSQTESTPSSGKSQSHKSRENPERESEQENPTGNPRGNNGSYDPDKGNHIGSVDNDHDFQGLGEPFTRKHPKPFTEEELKRLRSNGTPLELESLPPTNDEIDVLNTQCGISERQIADTNYIAQLRLYQNLIKEGKEPEESLEDFVKNAADVTTHKLKDGKYIHACSAARGVMYISPSVWNKLIDDKCEICVYLDGCGKNFHYINNVKEFLQLVEKDDVVIKITGKEKVDVVNRLYSDILSEVKGTAYTLIRVASSTNMDAVFAHYVGAMAEAEDGNDENEY